MGATDFPRTRFRTASSLLATTLGVVALLIGAVTGVIPGLGRASTAEAVENQSAWEEVALDGWEVTGLNNRSDIVFRAPVWAFAEVGDRVFVGGRFTHVRRGPGSVEYPQSFLAAFDRASGEWISDFRPQIENGVYALSASPDGTRLLVGGEFTDIDGVPNTSGLAALDPVTGEVDPTFVANVTNANSVNSVKEIVTHGPHVYIAGDFTHVQGATGEPRRQYRVSRLDGVTGAVDTSFDVRAGGGKVWALAIPPDGSRLYLGGFFSSVNAEPATQWFAAVDLATGRNVIPNPDPHRHPQDWVFDLAATNDHVYVAGERHLTWVHRASDLELVRLYFTNGYGGDHQALHVAGDRLIAGGHFHGWEEERNPVTLGGIANPQFGQVQWVGEWDTTTARPRHGFAPRLDMRTGVWALLVDSDGKLWVGGDPTVSQGISTQGFAVFPTRDPNAPVNLARSRPATQSSVDGTVLRWRNQTAAQRCPRRSHGLAGAATDGKVAGGLWECSTSHTARETNPWWQVDLGASRHLDLLRVHAMWGVDDVTGVRFDRGLDDARVYFSDTPLTGSSHEQLAAAANGWITLGPAFSGHNEYPLENISGRYIRIVAWGENRTLDLAEVEVYDLYGDDRPTELRGLGAEWAYDDSGVEQPGWTAPDFDDSGWPRGPGQLGFDDGDEGTVTGDQVLTTYARGTFTVDDPDALTSVSVDVIADDGAAVHVNGYEIGRVNLPDGPLTADTFATATVWGAAENEPVSFLVSPGILVPGENTLAIEVHNNRRTGGDLSLDARVVESSEPPPAPPAPEPERLVASGDLWRIDDSGVEVPGWHEPAFDAAIWTVGATPFGFGEGHEATVTRDGVLTTFARITFEASDVEEIAAAELAVIRDDGVALYLNGTEVWRSNLPDGPLTADTFATASVWGAAERTPTVVTLDPALLQEGINTLAVRVHNNRRAGGDLGFDADLLITR